MKSIASTERRRHGGCRSTVFTSVAIPGRVCRSKRRPASALVLPETGVPADLWLFDATYWSKVEGFVRFCDLWHHAGRLAGGRRDAARFVCIYRPRTQTEEVADDLRRQIAM